MSHFNEAQLERSIIELMQEEEYIYSPGDTIEREPYEVLLQDDLRTYLRKRYSRSHITEHEISKAIMALTATDSSNLYEQNATILRRVMNGFKLQRDDPKKLPLFIEVLNFRRPKDNIFRIVNQFPVQGECLRIPDAIVFINGLPLVVFEFKNAIKENTTIEDAYTQLTVRYRRDIPQLFAFNAFVVISDGVNNKFGSLFAPYDFFYGWRKIEHTDSPTDGINSLFTLVHGLFRKDRIVDVIHHFIFFPDNLEKEKKMVCRYPQYFATTLLRDNVLKHSHLNPDGDGKGGVYFGATGCGKSLTMLYLTRQLMGNKKLASPTIVLITDRTDLDDQLSELFLNAKKFVNDETILQVESREKLSEHLRDRTSGGVYLTTIQKFEEKTGLLSDRSNIICISDEAHRSQAGLGQRLVVTEQGVKRTYGFAKYLRDSFPNATYVGFSGTPLDSTYEVFGDEVDNYTMIEAVADGVTRRIVYEGRAAKVILNSEKVKEIEKYYNQCAQEGTTEHQIEESKKAMTRMDVILNDPDLIAHIAADFVAHYEKRVEEGATVKGKAMFVCSSRSIAWNLYQAILKLRPEWSEMKECCEGEELSEEERKTIKPMARLNMVITRSKDDPAELYNLLGTDEYRKSLDDQFKEVKSNFKIAIVVDMWITGFDVPCLDTMYCFKPLQMHTLVQTISRVNRPYPGKKKGLVVDYLGIKNKMNEALKQYGGGDMEKTSVETMEQSIKMVLDELDIIRRMFVGYDYSVYHTGKTLEQLECLNGAVEYAMRTKESEKRFMGHCKKLRSAYSICCNSERISQTEDDDIHFFFAVNSIIRKMIIGEAPDATVMNRRVAEMIKDALISEDVEEISKIGVNETDEVDVLSKEYMERLQRIPQKNIKVKLMERLLKQVISSLQRVNKAKGVEFTKRLEALVQRYNDRSDDTTLANEVIDEVAQQMANLLKDLIAEKKSGDDMGLQIEEKAFYDILKSIAVKYEFDDKIEDDKLIELSKEIKVIVDECASVIDWSNRDDIKDELKMNIIVSLAKAGYPPVTNDEVFKEILEQAENFKKYSNTDSYIDRVDNRGLDYGMAAESKD
jgi:type I restriction enzyme R subunit